MPNFHIFQLLIVQNPCNYTSIKRELWSEQIINIFPIKKISNLNLVSCNL